MSFSTASASSSVLTPQVAGSSYPAHPAELSEALARSLVTARSSSIQNAKLVVAPLSPLHECGSVVASAFANLANRRGIVRKVVVLGPARNVLRGFVVPTHTAFSTPLGMIELDRATLRLLRPFPEVSEDDRGFDGEPAIESVLPLIQACLGSFTLVPILVGNVSSTLVSQVLAQVWGGPETLIVVTSDLSHNLSDDRCRAFDVETRGIIETQMADRLTTARADGHRIIAGALMRAAALDLRVTGLEFRTAPLGNGRFKGFGAFAFESAQAARLSAAERAYVLKSAALAVQSAAAGPETMAMPLSTGRVPMTLSALRAATVTLERGGAVRGRAGGLRPYKALLTEVMARAAQAAVGDNRFTPVKPEECQDLSIIVDIMSHPRPLPAKTQEIALGAVLPGRDGLIFEDRGRISIAYPSAWRNIADPELFLRALKQQAGFQADHWSPTVSIRRFTTETFSGRIGDILPTVS